MSSLEINEELGRRPLKTGKGTKFKKSQCVVQMENGTFRKMIKMFSAGL
jgi:hypothetical protein